MSYEPATSFNGFLKATRSHEPMELIRRSRNAFALAYIIASRARWRDGFNADGLSLGEALIGDHDEYGMTRQEYRTALKQLEKFGFVASQTTSRGTIAKLLDARLFDPLNLTGNQQTNQQPTTKQPPPNHQLTTNEELKTGKTGKNGKNYDSLRLIVLKNGEIPELMRKCREVLGENEMKAYDSRWYKRAQSDPDKLSRVLDDTETKHREDGLDNAAAWAETMWKKFDSKNRGTSRPSTRASGGTNKP